MQFSARTILIHAMPACLAYRNIVLILPINSLKEISRAGTVLAIDRAEGNSAELRKG